MRKREILWWMLFSGIICHMFQMTNINVAIISMVKQEKSTDVTGFCYAEKVNSSRPINRSQPNDLRYSEEQHNKFNWNEQEKNLVLGAFFWLTWASELLGGILAHKYGSKMIFGFTNFIACALSSAIPYVAPIGSNMVVIVRLLQGTIGSVGLPAGIVTIIGHWAPPDERGKFVSATLGIPLGISIGYPFFGFLQDYFNWQCIFHATTAIGVLWYILWYFWVHDTPDQHPRISEKEKNYIKKSLSTSATREKLPIPWKEIFTSVPVLVNIFCTFGQCWVLLSIGMYYPMYLKNVHDLDSKQIGLITGLPFLLKSLLQIVGGIITDSMIKRGMPRTRVRNLAVLSSSVIPGFLLLGFLFTKCDVIWAVSMLSFFIFTTAFASSGAPVASIDMSPNFCGIIQGISCSIGSSAGFLGAIVLNYLSSNYETLDAWGYFFAFIGLINMMFGIIFMLFSDSEVQPWNNPKESIQEEHLQKINNS